MPEKPINANIVELPADVLNGVEPTALERDGGTYHAAILRWLPRKGDLIKLYSSTDDRDGHEPWHFYEVVQVRHDISDYDERHPEKLGMGGHHVTIYVKLSRDKLFED
jgi:hypothetical protein